jgi:transcriptional regulator with XRE-family HTH domain
VRISQNPQVALGRAIRLRREEIGLTQEALADSANLDPTSIRGLERGIANPTWDVIDRIARAHGAITLHQRWIELDRGTARPAEQLASKITRYTRLRYYAPPGTPGEEQPEPLWRRYYRSFPHLLIVLADQPRERMHQRIQRTLALHHSDPAKDHLGTIPVSFVTLDELTQRGPFAPIFISA